jgi:hypothetical protein
MRFRHLRSLPALALLLAATACTTVSNDLLQEVGTTVLFLTDTDLQAQSAADPEEPIQVAEWSLSEATLFLDDAPDGADLLFGEPCNYTDTVYVSPNAEGLCASGLVVGADESTAITVTLTLNFTMQVRRAKPVLLSHTGDFDIDEIPNQADICPYAWDPGQEDENSDGLGDACALLDPVTGASLADTDGDGWPDLFDNCVWEPNPDQADTTGAGADDNILDGIGDACIEQQATVSVPPDGITLGPIELTQLQGRLNYLTVDFLSGSSLVSCNWEAGICELNPEQVRFCVRESLSSAGNGCP